MKSKEDRPPATNVKLLNIIISFFLIVSSYAQSPQSGSRISGSISPIGEVDTWEFTLGVGENLRAAVGITSAASFPPLLRVLNDQNEEVTSNGGSRSTNVSFTADEAGIYRVLLSEDDSSPDAVSDYNIHFFQSFAEPIVPVGDQGGTIENGGRVAGSTSLGDMDIFSFEATEGETIRLGVGETTELFFNPFLLLYAPNGRFISSNTGSSSADIVTVALETGTYRVVIQDGNNDVSRSGDYSLYLATSLTDFIVPAGDEGGEIPNGGRVSGAVSLGDHDIWTFEASAGEAIRLGVGETTDLFFNPFLLLYGPNGDLIDSNSGSSSADIVTVASESGTYRVIIQDGNTDVSRSGNYNLYLATSFTDFIIPAGDEGGDISNGGRVSGTVSLGDHDIWTFEASAGEVIRLGVGETTDLFFEPFLLLYAPNGDLIDSNSGSSSADIVAVAPENGTYRVIVQDGNTDVSRSGDYNLYLATSLTDFIVPAGDEGGDISNGGRVSGTVSLGDHDIWTFEASAGEVIRLGVGETTDLFFEPFLLLYAPNGNLLRSNSGSSSADIVTVASETGTYRVVVQDGNTDVSRSGNYNLYCAVSGRAFIIPPGDQGGSLTPGVSAIGSIQRGEHDLWEITAEAGDTLSFTVSESGGNRFDPAVIVYDSTGALVGFDSDSTNASLTVAARTTGKHLVLVQDFNSDVSGSGNYSLLYQPTPRGLTLPAGSSSKLNNGAREIGGVDSLSEFDKWSFSASEGETVWLQVAEQSGNNFDLELRIFDPSGKIISRTLGASATFARFVAQVEGEFVAVVSEFQDDAVGSYEIFHSSSVGDFTIPTNDDGGLIPNGESRDGGLQPGDLDIWEIEVSAGDTIFVQLEGLSGTNFDPFLQIFNPQGDILAQTAANPAAAIRSLAEDSGRYRILVRENEASSPGDYRIHFGVPKDGFSTITGDEGDLISNGESRDGAISSGDFDLWAFEAREGDTLLLQLGETGGRSFEPELLLYSPTGSPIARSSGAQSASISTTAPESGVYRFVVRDADLDGTGTYRIHWAIPKTGHITPLGDEGILIPSGETRDGFIILGDLDIWEIQGTANEVLQVSVGETSGTNFEPLIDLYGPDGTQVGNSFGNENNQSSLRLRLSETGIYRLVVRDLGTNGSGSYRVHTLNPNQPFSTLANDEGGSIEDGSETEGGLGVGDFDPFGFYAEAGDHVSLTLARISGTDFDPIMSIYGPDGERVAFATGTASSSVVFTPTLTGRHVVVVSERGGSDTGIYQLNITGTSEPDVTSLFKISRLADGRIELSWPSPATNWVLQRSSDLTPESWETISTQSEDNGFERFFKENAEEKTFYRLRRKSQQN